MIVVGDCVEEMAKLEAGSIDAIVCDPPYGLEFMGKEWDRLGDAKARIRQPSERDRRPGVAHNASTSLAARNTPDAYVAGPKMQEWHYRWAVEAFRVLKPGGYLLAFGGSRTYHRLACAVEDAGFEIRDEIATLLWMHGQGFPKSHDVSKAIDEAAGVEREVVGQKWSERYPNGPGGNTFTVDGDPDGTRVGPQPLTAPATPEAKEWDGWGTALKPAHEPIVVARKPLVGTVVENVLEHGTGAINVDGCRVGFAGDADERESKDKNQHADFGSGPMVGNSAYGGDWPDRPNYDPEGRWPANVVLIHHDECARVGMKRVRSAAAGSTAGARVEKSVYGDYSGAGRGEPVGYSDADGTETVEAWECVEGCPVRELDEQSGALPAGNRPKVRTVASPFNANTRQQAAAHPTRMDAGGASRFFYCAKSSRAERNAGLDAFEKKPLLWSSGEQNPGSFQAEGTDKSARNDHPTVKPIALMRWLARMVTRPGGRVLDPFAGSGTTGCACALEGFEFVGIERDEGYVAIAEARIAFWRGRAELGDLSGEVPGEYRKYEELEAAGQMNLLEEAS